MRHLISDLRGNPIYTSFGSWRSRNGNLASSSRSNTAQYNPRAILFLHVRSSDWNAVIQRVKTHPLDVLMIDDNGNTPLHIACQLDPPAEVLVSLKEAVEQTNSWGATPLHIAASHRCNAQTLKQLIDFFPGALCRLSRMHRTPIHYACMSYRGLDLVAFQVLLEATLAESRRLKEYQQAQKESDHEKMECDPKITDFIDIIQETKDDFRCDEMLDDEEISVLMMDNDPPHGVEYSSSGSMHVPSERQARQSTAGEVGEEDNIIVGPNNNNYNVVTWKDSTGKTPLGLLFRRYRERVKRVIEILEKMKNSGTNSAGSSSSLQTDLGHLWGKARLIVVRLSEEYQQTPSLAVDASEGGKRVGGSIEDFDNDDDSSAAGQHWSLAAKWSKEQLSSNPRHEISKHHNDIDLEDKNTLLTEERQFRIVHASVGLAGYGCPPEMIRLAISIYPHQVREMDEDGNLPIHIAATASSIGTHMSSNSVADEELSVFSDSIVSLFSASSAQKNGDSGSGNGSFDRVIKLLLKQYPQAAQTPHGRSGRLPLVLADRAGDRTWNDGMKTLLRAYPPALFSGSKGMIPIKLYPHVLSLIGGGDPPDAPQSVRSNTIDFQTTNATSMVHRGCYGNRFIGRGGIGLLHNLLLLKQRHIRELMAGTASTQTSNNSRFTGGRHLFHMNSNVPMPPSTRMSVREQHVIRRGNFSQRIGAHSSAVSSAYENGRNGQGKQPNRKVRKEYATTMFELLRAKPDLIETARSHKGNSKLDLHEGRSSTSSVLVSARELFLDRCNASRESSQSEGKRDQLSPRTRKKITSRTLLERMKVYERDI